MMDKEMLDDTVVVGTKEPDYYIPKILDEIDKRIPIAIRARGRNIPKAIGIVEFLKTKGRIEVYDVEIGSDYFSNDRGERMSVSTINIKVVKSGTR